MKRKYFLESSAKFPNKELIQNHQVKKQPRYLGAAGAVIMSSMMDSAIKAAKYIEESARSATSGASLVLQQTNEMLKQNTKILYETCSKCSRHVPLYTNILNQNKCRMCCQIFCEECLTKSAVIIPNELLAEEFRPQSAPEKILESEISTAEKSEEDATLGAVSAANIIGGTTGKGSDSSKSADDKANVVTDDKQLLCKHDCLPRALAVILAAFHAQVDPKIKGHVDEYLSKQRKQHFFFPIPTDCEVDSAYRTAIRAAYVAEYIARATGFSMAYNAIKYAYYGSELVSILTEGGMIEVLGPLVESLKSYGVTGPTAMLRLYYLGCCHTMRLKLSSKPMSLKYRPERKGVLFSQCPLRVLEYVRQYMPAAEWMYVSNLPPPHNDNEWGSWYLAQIIRRQGWTLLYCINSTNRIPDGTKCPAFALVARCYRESSLKSFSHTPSSSVVHTPLGNADCSQSDGIIRELMLVIRGSVSAMDWAINLQETISDFDYMYLKRSTEKYSTSSFHAPGSSNTSKLDVDLPSTGTRYEEVRVVSGRVHEGIKTAALAILDGYNLRPHLMRFLSNGYLLKVVGHSLGGGCAALIAAELRTMLIKDSSILQRRNSIELLEHQHSDLPATPCDTLQLLSNISAVVFSCPALVSPNLAEAFMEDHLLVNTVLAEDFVPRFSFRTMELLAEELKDPAFIKQADAWAQQDKDNLSEYAATLGRVRTITSAVTARSMKVDAENAKEEETGSATADETNTVDSVKNDPPYTVESAQMRRKDLTVTPGPIVHLYRERNGQIHAGVVTHEHHEFKRMTILPSHLLDNHLMPPMREAMRSLMYCKRSRDSSIGSTSDELAVKFGSVEYEDEDLRVEQYFSLPAFLPANFNDGAPFHEPQTQEVIGNPAQVTHSSVRHENSGADYGDTTVATEDDEDDDVSILKLQLDRQQWIPCSVCGVDVTWPYILHSDASRSRMAHNCSACGKVVCALCSPSGDQLPGDGVNQYFQLPDLRITLPRFGRFELQRVCLLCYFDS